MKNPIQVAIGVKTETSESPMEFILHDEGARIDQNMTLDDLIIADAILRDLADVIATPIAQLTN